jgi:hypothetical protein
MSVGLAGLLCASGPALVSAAGDRLTLLPPLANGWLRFDMPGAATNVFVLQGSRDLQRWTNVALTIGGLAAYPDPASTNLSHRFYRVHILPKATTNDWKNQIAFPTENFLSAPLDNTQPRWVKFAILTADPTRVYYQDSTKFVFHYEFAVARLGPFQGMSRPDFDAVTLFTTNQAAVLGAVLYAPGDNAAEYGIQFVGLEPYPVELVARWFELVRAGIVTSPGVQALYMPTLEQRAAAEAYRDFFAARGIALDSAERWATSDALYAPGWAVGRLRYIPRDEIAAAYADGRLLPTDILLTDAVPAEVPFVAGIISQSAATPNSHVAILARSYGVPFVYLMDPAARARVLQWTNREVVLRASTSWEGNVVEVLDVEGQLDAALRAELLALKEPPAIQIQAKTPYGAFSADTANLVPADIRYFGGKAANFGLLRRTVPSNSPPGLAFSFDLWDAFMEQAFAGGPSLRAAISNRLSGYTYPPGVPALQTDLAVVRDWITSAAGFNATLRQVITNALRGFDPLRKIRFRSSTNVEDSEHFTGAGLYDSYSGCLADDLDGDTAGPCHCDPTEPRERGVFRAIQKVYASLYNDNAFLERLRHRVNESQVGMGVLVHYSFPDEEELANGVATLSRAGGSWYELELVTQDGPVSVTNPDGSALPEVVAATKSPYGTWLNLKARSSLVPLGAYVLQWDGEYRQLVDLLAAVAEGFRQIYTNKNAFTLDFEYKKVPPAHLVVKQVREVPSAGPATNVAAFLINRPSDYSVFQGEYGTVFANHRLKSRWHLETPNVRLTTNNLQQCLFTNVAVAFLLDGATNSLTGSMKDWPGYRHGVNGSLVWDEWTLAAGRDRRDVRLEATTRTQVPVTQPLVSLWDFPLEWAATYAGPQPALDYNGAAITVTNETVRLASPLAVSAESLLQTRTASGTNGVTVSTVFYWPKPPTGVAAGYTAPLVEFVETEIAGLTTQPLVLRDFYSQTYRPGHHNFSEEFLFEPRLDPNVTPAQQAELVAAKVLLVYARVGLSPATVRILTTEGKWR